MKKTLKLLCVSLCVFIALSFSAFASNNLNSAETGRLESLQPYTGENFSGQVNGKIKQNNNQVQIFENNMFRYMYQYDNSNFRTKKIIFKLPFSKHSTPVWEIDYIWGDAQILGYTFTNENQQKTTVNICYDENGSKIGFSILNRKFDFVIDEYKEIIDIYCGGQSICDIEYNENKTLETVSSDTTISSELMKIILLTVPFSEGLVTLDCESGYEYSPRLVNPHSSNPFLLNSDKFLKNQTITPYSYEYIYVYLYKPTGISLNPFGHLDIQINTQIHSYADYSSGNYMIASSVSSYQNFQRNKYSITSCTIIVPPPQKSNILSFFTSQNKTFKAYSPSFSSGAIYKINSGKYKTYILPTVNCSTFVLDGLRMVFNDRINYLSYTYNTKNTPTSIFELCQRI